MGPWLPEPLVRDAPAPGGPEDRVTLDESVGMALLAVLEKLTPAERTAFVLHEVFAVPFGEIAEVVGRSPQAVRQLASRARRRVREQAPRRRVERGEHRRAVEAFLDAVAGGDLEGLMAVLDPRVVWHSDGGGRTFAARVPVVGAERVAGFARRLMRAFDPRTMSVRVREVNGAAGLVFTDPAGGQAAVFAFTVAGPGGTTVNTWRYELRPAAGGTDVTESFELADLLATRLYWMLAGRARRRTNLDGMRATLDRIRAIAEAA